MTFTVIIAGFAVALIALAALVGYRAFSSRQAEGASPLVAAVERPRELLSKLLSALSYFGILGALVGMSYRRTHELYAAKLGVIWFALPVGFLAACANRYCYGRWI